MSTINLNSLKQEYDAKVIYVKRMIKSDPKSKSYWKAFLHGVYAAIDHIIQCYIAYEDLPKMIKVKSTSKKGNKYFYKIGEIQVFDQIYNIYFDDYGQCYSLELGEGNYIALGTFNTSIVPEVIYLVFKDIHDKTLDSLDEIE